MKRYCSVCQRRISVSSNGKICRHGFKKNRWIFSGSPKLANTKYRKVDGTPCKGSGKLGLSLKQLKKTKKMKFNDNKEWLEKMMEAEDARGGNIASGGPMPDFPAPTVGMSEFAKRQSEDSVFTHFEGDWDKLIDLTREQMKKGNISVGYRDGVILVHMSKEDAKKFLTFDAYPMFEGMKLDAQWAKTPGREHEPAKL
ncbi:unnamed protein product, partial [marine sediment metagenome]